jgi:hypothetical protein
MQVNDYFSFAIMKKTVSLFLGVILLASAPHHASAWGKKGHGIVAEIAYSMLDSNTKQAVTKYLNGTSIQSAATWMDEVRSDHSYDYMKTWHYVNIAKGHQYEATKEGNIINALNTAINELEHRDKLSDEDIKKNLMIVFHLAGDLHMPLHVGYETDKGGNDVHITYMSKPTNLHKLWDTDIIEQEDVTANSCMVLYNRFDKNEISSFKVINTEKWINEPRGLLSTVYHYHGDTIDQAYVDKNLPIIKQQLLIAGIRLAAVLEQVFKA